MHSHTQWTTLLHLGSTQPSRTCQTEIGKKFKDKNWDDTPESPSTDIEQPGKSSKQNPALCANTREILQIYLPVHRHYALTSLLPVNNDQLSKSYNRREKLTDSAPSTMHFLLQLKFLNVDISFFFFFPNSSYRSYHMLKLFKKILVIVKLYDYLQYDKTVKNS